jgi:hypothetical protein
VGRRFETLRARKREGAVGTHDRLSVRELLLFGVALYLGEGFKGDGHVGLANTDPDLLRVFVTWLRHVFSIDETRLRVRLYLDAGLDLEAAKRF